MFHFRKFSLQVCTTVPLYVEFQYFSSRLVQRFLCNFCFLSVLHSSLTTFQLFFQSYATVLRELSIVFPSAYQIFQSRHVAKFVEIRIKCDLYCIYVGLTAHFTAALVSCMNILLSFISLFTRIYALHIAGATKTIWRTLFLSSYSASSTFVADQVRSWPRCCSGFLLLPESPTPSLIWRHYPSRAELSCLWSGSEWISLWP